jgi:DNA-binding response OmpR family regulator
MLANRTILIVEDDAALRETLADHLTGKHGFVTFVAGTLHEADAIINDKGRHIEAVILDVGMPDGDGRDFCAQFRRNGHNVPVIMLTGSDDEVDVVRGLDVGANDYITKPFRSNELVARLRAHLRTFDDSVDATFTIGRFQFRPYTRLLKDAEKKRGVRLTAREAAILKFLYRANGQPVDRHLLLHELWGDDAGITTHTLETHIYRLRQKIEPDPANPTLLVTESGGYRLYPEAVAARGV